VLLPAIARYGNTDNHLYPGARNFSDDSRLSLGPTETSYGSDAESTSDVPYLRNRDSQQDLTDYEAYLATLPPPDGIASGEGLGNL
jgi:hypothetical protein